MKERMGDIGSWLHEYAEFLLEYSLEGQRRLPGVNGAVIRCR